MLSLGVYTCTFSLTLKHIRVCTCTSALCVHKRMQEYPSAVRDDCIINSYSYSHRERGKQINIKNRRLYMHACMVVYSYKTRRNIVCLAYFTTWQHNSIQSQKQHFRIKKIDSRN